jgi:signal transduction histidine kinase
MNQNRILTVLLFLLLPAGKLIAQDTSIVNDNCIDISTVKFSKSLGKYFKYAFAEQMAAMHLPDVYGTFKFRLTQATEKRSFIPNENVTQRAILRFTLCNSADTAMSIWFFPGLHFWDINLYKDEGDKLTSLPDISPDHPDHLSYRSISLGAHDSAVIIADLTQVRTYLNKIDPLLINHSYLPYYIRGFHESKPDSKLITYLFCGLLLMLILYSLANFLQDGNREFLFYSGYAFFLGLMLFIKAIFSFHTTRLSFFQEEYLDFVMQSVGLLFYMAFMQKFLATKTEHPFLYKLYNAGMGLLFAAVITYSILHFSFIDFSLENGVENMTKFLLLGLILIFLFYSLRHWEHKLLRYLFWGNLCLFIFSLLSQLIVLIKPLAAIMPGILSNSLFYYEMGLFLELVFFLAGLNYKNRRQLIGQAQERERLKAENQMKEYEKELAVFKAQQEERERISADMHDELGSGMTAIRLMSEIARNKMKEQTPVEIEKISHSADEVLNKMNAIIWSMNSGNDTVDNLISYIRSYALEYFENTPIDCRVNVPGATDNIELTGDKRRNIFLCVKETLNNAMKHSKASEIKINIAVQDRLEIYITDNGVGINLERIRQFGNGLKNIAKRMSSIGGTYKIENREGTVTILTLPL